MEGTCNCGSITVKIHKPETGLKVSLCHCLDCRASGGSLFAVNIVIPAVKVTVDGTEKPRIYTSLNRCGQRIEQKFLSSMRIVRWKDPSPIWYSLMLDRPILTTITGQPDIIFVKGGMFRRHGYELEKPFKEQWFRRAENWETHYVKEAQVQM